MLRSTPRLPLSLVIGGYVGILAASIASLLVFELFGPITLVKNVVGLQAMDSIRFFSTFVTPIGRVSTFFAWAILLFAITGYCISSVLAKSRSTPRKMTWM